MSRVQLMGVNLALCLTALTFALVSQAPTGPALAFVVAAIVCVDRAIAAVFATLAFGLALGQIVPSPPVWTDICVALAGGVAIGALTRSISAQQHLLRGESANVTGVLLGIACIGLAVLPDGWILLQDPTGVGLTLNALVQDASTGTRLEVTVPAVIAHAAPLSGLFGLIPWLGGLAVVTLMYDRVAGPQQRVKNAFYPLAAVGIALMVFGLIAQLDLAMGEVTLPNAEMWRSQINLAGGGGVVIDRLDMPSDAAVGLGSRATIDILRLLFGALVFAFARAARRDMPSSEPTSTSAIPFVVATAALLLIVLPIGGSPQSYGFAAALVLAAAASFVGVFSTVPKRMPFDLAFLSLVVVTLSLVGPISGWMYA